MKQDEIRHEDAAGLDFETRVSRITRLPLKLWIDGMYEKPALYLGTFRIRSIRGEPCQIRPIPDAPSVGVLCPKRRRLRAQSFGQSNQRRRGNEAPEGLALFLVSPRPTSVR